MDTYLRLRDEIQKLELTEELIYPGSYEMAITLKLYYDREGVSGAIEYLSKLKELTFDLKRTQIDNFTIIKLIKILREG